MELSKAANFQLKDPLRGYRKVILLIKCLGQLGEIADRKVEDK